jgi:tRNA(fMet)-specific endonuclease VapC
VFLLDTNVVSELVKRAPEAKLLGRIGRESPNTLFISSVTVFELRFGPARSAKPASLWARIQCDILQRFQVLPFTEQDALAAADLLAPLVAGGQNCAVQDMWLAGVAFGRNLTFVTRNRRDFDRITGLKVENLVRMNGLALRVSFRRTKNPSLTHA